MNATVAVTGGRGFIGRRVINRCSALGYRIVSASRSPQAEVSPDVRYECIDFIKATVPQLEAFLMSCDTLVHIAGEIRDETVMRALHVESTKSLTEAAARVGLKHWIQISSCGVYGPVRVGRVTETAPCRPVGVYEETKWESENIVSQFASSGAFGLTILRPSIVYGDDMPNDSLRALIRAIQRKRFFFIGPSGAKYNAIHADDLADVITACVQYGADGVATFNLSQCYTIEQLVKTISLAAAASPPSLRLPKSIAQAIAFAGKIIPRFPLTLSRIEALTSEANYVGEAISKKHNWAAKVSLEQGIASLIAQMEL